MLPWYTLPLRTSTWSTVAAETPQTSQPEPGSPWKSPMQSSCVYADSVPYTRHMPSSPFESLILVALHCALMAASALIGCSDSNTEVELAETTDMQASVDGAPFVLDASSEGDAASTDAPSATDTRATDTSVNDADLHDATPTDGTVFDLNVPDAS